MDLRLFYWQTEDSNMYINAHTCYSFHYGTIMPKELLEQLSLLGHRCVGVTDINNTSALLDLLRMAPRFGMHVVPGIEFRNQNKLIYIALARNNRGYECINRFLSEHAMRNDPFPDIMPDLGDVYVVYPLSNAPSQISAHEYVGVPPHMLSKLRFSDWNERREKLVAMPSLTFLKKEDHHLHLLLQAIQQNTLLSKLDSSFAAHSNECLKTPSELYKLYEDFPELLSNCEQILYDCKVAFDFSETREHVNLKTYTGDEEKDFQLLSRLCRDGVAYRYPDISLQVTERIARELEVIRQQGYVSYFLINWDITRYARSKGYFYVGRGSGANSIVAYLLRITDVDPIELDLYFERFINLYRKNPPDFDIDFSWRDRDDITRYIFERFPHVALLGSYVTFQYKATVRELGKVFGIPPHEIDKLGKHNVQAEQLDDLSLNILRAAQRIIDLPSHLSIHAAGILISNKPIYAYTGTFMPPKGFPTTHIDMIVAEDVGLYKFDILSQRGLGKIKDALVIIRQNQPDADVADIHDVRRFKHDPNINALLRDARAIGCFYVESPAMRMLLTKLRVDNYLGLVAASSVIRPGVAQSGMMREYILRYRYPDRRKDAHPVMLELMPETYGVMVYQEDVIKVAHFFAGLTLGEADMLRRGMSGKYRSREEFEQVKQQFMQGAQQKGHSLQLAQEIWRQTESFAGYAFAKGHSASYAVESYQSLYLKTYFPLEYMVATLNNGGGFYSREHYIHEARMLGAEIRQPCVNRGDGYCTIYGSTIILGMLFIKGVEHDLVDDIIKERDRNGLFLSLTDFTERIHAGIEQLSVLIRAGAFAFTGKNPRELLWEASLLLSSGPRKESTGKLFDTEVRTFTLPSLQFSDIETAYDQIELLGFPLCDPFQLLSEKVRKTTYADELPELEGREVVVHGYLVTTKLTRTIKKEGMFFGTFLDPKGNWIDTVHFPPVAQRYPFRGKGVYRIKGKVVVEFDAVTVEVHQMDILPMVRDPRYNPLAELRNRSANG